MSIYAAMAARLARAPETAPRGAGAKTCGKALRARFADAFA
jgi:hypothetical protein